MNFVPIRYEVYYPNFLFIRHYKKKQNDTSYYNEQGRKNVVETEVFDSNWKPRCDLSQLFFSNPSNSNSTFSQILAERKPMVRFENNGFGFLELRNAFQEGLWGCSNRLDTHNNDIFGGSHMKSETSKVSAGIKSDSPVVILDDDSDDDGVVLVSEDIKVISS